MPVAVTVTMKGNGLAYLRELVTKVPKIGLRETWNLARFGAKAIREQHEKTSIKFRRKISKGIHAKKLKKATYGILIPQEGIYLDRMAPHWVALKRGRLITQWAEQRGIIDRNTGGLPRAIEVHAHPFVQAGFMRMLNKADIVANKIANKIGRG